MISGLSKGMEENEIISKVIRGLSDEIIIKKEEFKIIKRFQCRNIWKENVIVKTNIENFKYLVKKGKVEIDCMMYYVEEYLSLAMCFNCCKYGHVSKYCKEKSKCHLCAGDHNSNNCNSNIKKCIVLKCLGK